MATVKIKKVTTRLDHVINYICNLEKTDESRLNDAELKSLYTLSNGKSEIKTEKKLLVDGINIDVNRAYEQMIETKKRFNKTGGILAFHSHQSFAPGEVTPETALEIGRKYAEEMWGDYEVVIATHVNTGVIHNHILINSVSYVDGKKYNDCKANYQKMRDISDRLCREYGLSVIENPGKSKRQNYKTYMDIQNGKQTKDRMLKNEIDYCISISYDAKHFIKYMKRFGYEFDFDAEKPTVMHPTFRMPRRLNTLGKGYSLDDITARLYKNYNRAFQIPMQQNPLRYFPQHKNIFENYRSVYVNYVLIIGNIKSDADENLELMKYLADDMDKFDKRVEEQNLMLDNNLFTDSDVEEYKEKTLSEIQAISSARQQYRNELKKAVRAEDETKQRELKSNISDLSKRLGLLRQQVRICDRITNYEPYIEKRLNDIRDFGEQNLHRKLETYAKNAKQINDKGAR